jgi:predicted phage tail protein
VGGTPYFYRVVAQDVGGNEGRPSNAIAALPVDDTAPEPPTGVAVSALGRSLEVRWIASPSSDVRGYYVYRGETAERLVRLVEQPVGGTSFVDSGYGGAGLAPGGRYTVTVSAVDNSYNESEAVAAEIAVPDDESPGAPTGLRATNALGRYVAVEWSPSASLDVRAYEVLRAAPGEPAAVLAEAPAAQGIVRDSTAAAGVTYSYQVVAVDSAGNRSGAASVTLAFADPTPPSAPRYAAAVLTAAGVAVSWERVVDDDLAGYHVFRSLLPTGVFERLTDAPVVDLRFSDPGGRAEHYYIIRAVDRSANESASSPAVRGSEP